MNVESEDEEIWDEEESAVMADFEPEPVSLKDLRPPAKQPQATCLVNWIIAFFSFFQVVFQLSDVVTSLWIQFLNILFAILGQFCAICRDIGETLPTSLHAMRSHTSANMNFRRYVVCKKCHSIRCLSQ